MERRPILLNSCASAASTAEARFRVDYPNSKGRATRVVSLDEGALSLIGDLTRWSSDSTHLLEFVSRIEGAPADARLRSIEGLERRLSDELEEADVAIMVASTGAAADPAAVVGRASADRRIMTAGLALGSSREVAPAVAALRPYAAVLVVSADVGFVPEMLAALRA